MLIAPRLQVTEAILHQSSRVEMDLQSMQTPSAIKPLWQTYLLFLAPMVLSNFLQSMSGTVNSIYIGQMLGTQALGGGVGDVSHRVLLSSPW